MGRTNFPPGSPAEWLSGGHVRGRVFTVSAVCAIGGWWTLAGEPCRKISHGPALAGALSAGIPASPGSVNITPNWHDMPTEKRHSRRDGESKRPPTEAALLLFGFLQRFLNRSFSGANSDLLVRRETSGLSGWANVGDPLPAGRVHRLQHLVSNAFVIHEKITTEEFPGCQGIA